MGSASYRDARVSWAAALVLGAAVAAAARAESVEPGHAPAALAEDAAYDAAVASLARRIEERPQNATLAARVAAQLPAVERDPEAAAAWLRHALEARALSLRRVPGLFWRRHPWTGADLARIEAWLGAPAPLVTTGEAAPVEENAPLVAAALREDAREGRRVILVSASKGSADVHAALTQDCVAAGAVALWVDLVGLIEGTPLTDPGTPAEERAALGLPEATATSMSQAVRREAARRPSRCEVAQVHVAAFPSLREISPRARAGFERLRARGPNDGFLLLDAFTRVPGPVLIVRGRDHYLGDEGLRVRLLALLQVWLHEGAGPEPPRDG